MARTTGALLSFGASGAIAKTQVYSSWRGIPYARRYVTPANPNTAPQQATRNTFKWANASWLFLPAIAKEPWEAYARGRPFVARNGWVSRCVALLRGEGDISLLEGSPGVSGGLPSDAMNVTADTEQIKVAFQVPDAPPGWTLTAAQALIVPQQDPEDLFKGPLDAKEVTTSPYEITFTGLTSAQEYVVTGWLKWDRGASQPAYSISRVATATPA